jgi:hypothetical protein
LLEIDASEGIDDETKRLLENTITPEQAVHLRELVQPLKCCDPAVGSGAFPVGLLHELVNLRRLLTTAANGYVDPLRHQGSTWLHETKADIVQNCLFGVDIQQQAIEICRLRLWLSLVVDHDLGLDPFTAERSQFSHAIERISQLPNLEMNFHRGDSLHDHLSGVPVVILPDRASRHADEFNAIAKLGARLHQAKSAETKKKLRLEILEKRLAVSQRILDEEMRTLRASDSALDTLFGLPESAAEKRKRNEQEAKRLEEALGKIEQDRNELERLRRGAFDNQFYPKLRKLEGADFDSPFNFAWRLDFPNIFGANGGGFDIIVGNPPFVTARNPVKRELWRERWPRVCHMKYSLVAPFFEMSFGLLRIGGQLGFIVSNAFAKRDFGEPLVKRFFPTVNMQKIVDCSGLLFPGHGTPTCILLGSGTKPEAAALVRVAAIMPGGGDLRTPPEESPLWQSLESHHDHPGYTDSFIEVSDKTRAELAAFPWRFESMGENTKALVEAGRPLLHAFCKSVGPSSITRSNEVFVQPLSALRRLGIETVLIRPFVPGDSIRNHSVVPTEHAIVPYDMDYSPIALADFPGFHGFARNYKNYLENVIVFGKPKKETDKLWYEFTDPYPEKNRNPVFVALSFIATHNHFVFNRKAGLFPQSAPVVKLADSSTNAEHQAICGVANSSSALFWLKQVCYNKGAGEDEERDRFEFAGGKVQELPLPQAIADGLRGNGSRLADRLTKFSQACWERGQQMPSLALKKLFEKPGEAYHEWNSSLPGYVSPNGQLGSPFESAESLRETFRKAQEIRERLRAEMIALQEEMDWLVYAAYGLLPENHPAAAPLLNQGGDSPVPGSPPIREGGDSLAGSPPGSGGVAEGRGGCFVLPLQREERPFRLWGRAEGDYAKAIALIPCEWPEWRKKLWQARLAAIRDNEHIRRIEQPVYKRRWDEQWKVRNQWRCGLLAYGAEFVDAFEWWLREKAEWWLEHKKHGGPVEIGEWTLALWSDPRVQAAWPVAAENYALLEYEKAKEKAEANGEPAPEPTPPAIDAASFVKAFKTIIDDETVPDGIPWATPYEELENKDKIKAPAKVKSIRGKLNVPRERFHLCGRSEYLWAGLQFRE